MEFSTWLEMEEDLDPRYFKTEIKPRFLGMFKKKQIFPQTKTFAGLLQKLKAHLKQGKIDPVEYKKQHAFALAGYEKELKQQEKKAKSKAPFTV